MSDARSDALQLAERLRSWAQNEEMVDQYFTAHGRDCSEAAELIAATPPCSNTCPKCGGNCKEMPCAYPEDCEHPCFDYIYERNQALLRAVPVLDKKAPYWIGKCKEIVIEEGPRAYPNIDRITQRLDRLAELAVQNDTPPQPASESEKIADLKRQLAGERDHSKRLQMQLDAILRTDGGSAKVLVPVVATEAEIAAVLDGDNWSCVNDEQCDKPLDDPKSKCGTCREHYLNARSAMLAAAPSPDSQEGSK